MLLLKKLIARILANNITGYLISKFFRDSIPFFLNTRINVESKYITNKIKAMIFFRLYEGYEARSVIEFLSPKDTVIELGSSIGGISVLIGKKIEYGRFYLIEANKNLIPIINKNLLLNGISNYKIINACIGNEHEASFFIENSQTTHGYISSQKELNAVKVVTIKLSEIIRVENISNYVLVCDIEGSEVELLFNDSVALKLCKLIIIETHFVKKANKIYNSKVYKEKIIELGFKCIVENGVNFVFKRTDYET